MSILGIRKEGAKKIDFVNRVEYDRDRNEEDLHRLIRDNPRIVVEGVEINYFT